MKNENETSYMMRIEKSVNGAEFEPTGYFKPVGDFSPQAACKSVRAMMVAAGEIDRTDTVKLRAVRKGEA